MTIEGLRPALIRDIPDLVEAAASIALSPTRVPNAFDLIDADSVKYLQSSTLNAVLKIKQETGQAICEAMVRGFNEGISTRELAYEVRSRVGLTDFQWLTVENYTRYIISLAGRFKRMDDLGDIALYRLRRGGLKSSGALDRTELTNNRADKLVENYTKRLTSERDETIARTWVIKAANEGQNILWRQAAQKGVIDPKAYGA